MENVEEYLTKHGNSLPHKATSPFTSIYRPEVDVTPELDAKDAAYYQSLIGILSWIVELGRADISVDTSIMALCMAMPSQGHLDKLYHVFALSKEKHNSEMVFDPTEPYVGNYQFSK